MSSLWPRVRPLVLFGWLVALIRFGIDASVKPERSNPIFYVGVDVLMPIAYLVVGIKAIWDDIPWKKYPLIALMLGVLVWFIPNAIVYTTAQFLGWQHGRFHNIPIRETAVGKLGMGLGLGGGTAIAGTLGSLLLMTLLIWLPGSVRRKKRPSAA
jgi:hypothetical protein